MRLFSRKMLVLMGLLLVTASLLTGCSGGQSKPGETGQPIVLKLSHDLSEQTPQHMAAVRFKEAVEQKTNGRVKVQIFPSNQLGSDREVTEMMQAGSVQGGLIPTAKLSLFAPALQLPDLPFLFPTRDICYKVLDSEIGEGLLEGLKAKNLVGVAFWESGFKQFTANKEIRKPEDFKGLKVRTMESPIIIEQFKVMGANPVPIDFGETYNALQQKVVDAQENPLVSIVRMRFYEVQTHLMVSNHAYLAYAFVFSKKWFDSVPADIQKVLATEAKTLAAFQRQETQNREAEFVQTIEKHGTKVVRLSPAELSAFAAATRPVHQKFEASIGKEILAKTYKKIEELAKTAKP